MMEVAAEAEFVAMSVVARGVLFVRVIESGVAFVLEHWYSVAALEA